MAEAALAADGRLLFKDGESFDLGDEFAQLIVTAYYAAELHDVVDIDERVDQQLQSNLSRDSEEDRSACDMEGCLKPREEETVEGITCGTHAERLPSIDEGDTRYTTVIEWLIHLLQHEQNVSSRLNTASVFSTIFP